MNKNVGLVLSGGGARGAAHIGVLHALNENDIYPSHISGPSAGALIGALYCAGFSPIEILELSKNNTFLKIFKIGLINKSLTEMTHLKEFLHQVIKNDSFENLKTPLHISVTNLNSGTYEIISKGMLIDSILASCAIPLLFKPVAMNGNLYVDGGVLNNLPIEPLLNVCEKTIGISVCTHLFKQEIKGLKQISERCIQLAIWNTIQDRFKLCDISIEIDKSFSYSMFSLKNSDELFKIGYDTTMAKMDSILNILK